MDRPNLVIDFGGTVIKLAIVRNGDVVARRTIVNRSDAGDFDRVATLARELCAASGVTAPGGVGVSVPGIVDSDRRMPISINGKYAYMVGVDLGAWATAAFGVPAVVDNDARMALLGEVGYGVARGFDNAVMMILGTGIGTAAVIDGRLLRGAHHQAGILGGHITIETGGHRCTCGNRGCAEAEAGSWNMPALVRAQPGFARSALASATELDFKAIADASREGDGVAAAVVARLVTCWAVCIVNLIHAYDPEVVVLSGGLMKSGDLILAPLRDYVAANAWVPSGLPDFRIAADSTVSVLLGLDYRINHAEDTARLP